MIGGSSEMRYIKEKRLREKDRRVFLMYRRQQPLIPQADNVLVRLFQRPQDRPGGARP